MTSQKGIFIFLAAAGFGIPLWATGPEWVNIYNQGAEFEMDRLLAELPTDWRDHFYNSENVFQISGGSLNIRHLYLKEKLKIRWAVVENRFWFRLRQNIQSSFERKNSENILELETRPVGDFFVSLVGEPNFNKSRSMVGAALRWGKSEGKSIRLALHFPDFDNNYAYQNKSTNEGFETYYRQAPRELRLEGNWMGEQLSFHLEGLYDRPWERETLDLEDPQKNFVEEGSNTEILFDQRWKQGRHLWSFSGEFWQKEEGIRFDQDAEGEDRDYIQEQNRLELFWRMALSEHWATRLGGNWSALRANMYYPVTPDQEQGYKVRDRIAFLYGEYLAGPGLWELGFLYNRQYHWETFPGGAVQEGPRSHRRAILNFRHDWGTRAGVRISTSWELDSEETEAMMSFDGGNVQFQVAL